MLKENEYLAQVPQSAPERLLPVNESLLVSPPSGRNTNPDFELRKQLAAIWKRRWLIAGIVLVITTTVAIHSYSLSPIYLASATLRVNPRESVSIQGAGLSIDSYSESWEYLETQSKLLTNPQLVRKVVLKLDLLRQPNTLLADGTKGPLNSFKRLFKAERTSKPLQEMDIAALPGPELSPDDLSGAQLSLLEPYVQAILGSLKVERQDQTNLLRVQFTGSNPEWTNKVVDSLAKTFVADDVQYENQGNVASYESVARQIADIQNTLKDQEAQRAEYLISHNLPLGDGKGQNLTNDRLQTLSGQLLSAENDRKILEARVTAAQAASDQMEIPEVQENKDVVSIQKSIRDLEQKRAALLETFTAAWPEVKSLNAQIAKLQKDMLLASKQVVSALKASYSTAVDREAKLRTSYYNEYGSASKQAQEAVGLDSLNRQIETNKQIFAMLFQHQKELEINSIGRSHNRLSIVTPSVAPTVPIGPARAEPVMLALFISLGVGIGFSYLLNRMDATISSMEDAAEFLSLPTLATVPRFRSRFALTSRNIQSASHNALELTRNVRSPTAEAYRNLRTSLLFSSTGKPPQSILVTSGHSLEGKTTTSVNLAIAFAQTGASVVIVDCDLRRPRVHKHFDVPNSIGLTNYLSGQCSTSELLIKCPDQPNLKIVTTGPAPANPADFLGSFEMKQLLETLNSQFDFVIIDSPPAASFADAPILSTQVDTVLLVIHVQRSSRLTAQRIKHRIESLGARIAGVVLNDASMSSQEYYSYYETGEAETAVQPYDKPMSAA